MAALSIVATAISIWAVKLVRDTLEETRKSVAAAERAVLESRRIGEAQTRAYISADDYDLTKAVVNGRVSRFIIQPAFRNFGQTPARVLAVHAKCTAYEGLETNDIPKATFEYQENVFEVGAGKRLLLEELPIQLSVANDVFTQEKRCLIFCYARYKDIFHKDDNDFHEVKICYEVSFLKNPNTVTLSDAGMNIIKVVGVSRFDLVELKAAHDQSA